MSEITVQNPFGTESIGKLMLRYSVPSIISIVVNSLYNMIDQIFIGQSVGYLGNAATTVIQPITTIVLALCMMIGDGTAAYLSLNLGKGEHETAAKGVGNGVTVTIGIGVVFLILFEIFLEPLCKFFGATESSLPYALDYGRIIVAGFPFFAVCAAFGSVIRADGRPKISMVGLLLGCIANIILDPLFIFVFHWGVKGAATATIIGQIVNAIYFLLCIARFESVKLEKRHLICTGKIVVKLSTLGVSSFITQIANAIIAAVLNNLLVYYGALSIYGADIPMAAFGITMKVNMLVSGIAMGLATGMQPIMGYNYGSGQYERVKKSFKLTLLYSTIILVVAFIIFQFFPLPIVRLFGQESGLYEEFAVKCFRTYLLCCFMIGGSMVPAIFFQSIGKPVQAAILSLCRQILFLIPSAVVFSYMIGVEGALWAGAFSDALACIVSLAVVKVCWKKIFGRESK